MSTLVRTRQITPPHLSYSIPKSSPIVNRTTVAHKPSNGTSFKSNGLIIIDVPATGFQDNLRTYMSFHSSVDDGTAPRFQSGGMPFLRRLRVSSGRNEEIEDIAPYNYLEHKMIQAVANDDWVQSYGDILGGYAGTNLQAMAGGKQHCVHLTLSGLFTSPKYWPLLITDGLRIEMYLDSVAAVTVSNEGMSADATDYTVKNVALVVETVDVNATMLNEFKSFVQSGQLQLHVPTYLNTASQSISGSRENVKITEAVRSIKSIWSTLRETASLNDGAVNSFHSRQFDLESYQYRFGNRYIPAQRVECGANGSQQNEGAGGANALAELLKSLNTFASVDNGGQLRQTTATVNGYSDGQDGGGDGSDNSSNNFIFGQNLDLTPEADVLSGLDANRQILDIQLIFAASPANQLTLDSFIYYDQIVQLDRNALHSIF